MTDITKFKNVSLSLKTYTDVGTLSKEIFDVPLSLSKTIEYLVEKELIEIYANSGFNGRQLGEAAKLYSKMIHENATICLTVAGALTPVGFGPSSNMWPK